jgi:hypothetical protein
MALYPKLRKKPTLFFATTGMSLHRFEALLPEFERVWAEREAQRKARVVKTGAERKRASGGGAQFSTEVAERLLMLLVYYRVYVTQEFLTLLFDVEDKATISRAIAQMRPVLEAVLPVPERARATALSLAEQETERRGERAGHPRGRRIGNVADFVREYPELSILIDGTEQPKQRPQDKQKRKDHYSGKKKRHTLKQILTTTPGGLILDQSRAVGGRCHDFRAFKEHVAEGAPGAALVASFERLRVVCTTDSGFTGIEKLSLPCTTRVVARARRNHPLSPEQEVLNRVRSRERIRVEHAIGHRKRYRVASEVYRNRDGDYDGAMDVVAGLVNLRVYDRIEEQTGLDLLALTV